MGKQSKRTLKGQHYLEWSRTAPRDHLQPDDTRYRVKSRYPLAVLNTIVDDRGNAKKEGSERAARAKNYCDIDEPRLEMASRE